MIYRNEQVEKIRVNIQKVVAYIEEKILPHIDYPYETGNFGPMETWGRCDENRGQRYYIALNGPYADKIRFYHGICQWNAEDIADEATEHAVNFLKYWQDAKCYMNTEINNQKENANVIDSFEI